MKETFTYLFVMVWQLPWSVVEIVSTKMPFWDSSLSWYWIGSLSSCSCWCCWVFTNYSLLTSLPNFISKRVELPNLAWKIARKRGLLNIKASKLIVKLAISSHSIIPLLERRNRPTMIIFNDFSVHNWQS